MIDNEIINALECLHKRILQSKCAEEITETEIMGLVNAPKLINRQTAEIERLKDENKSIRYCYEQAKSYNDTLAESCEKNCKHFNMTTRAEAIKEFAEKLKNCFAISGDYLDIINIIDNLVKEMTEVEINQRKEDEWK